MKAGWVLILVVVGFWIFWPGSGQKWAEIAVIEGQNAHDVAVSLKSAGLIRTAVPFKLWTMLRRAGPRIQIGKYRFSHGRSAFWIVDDLIQGRTEKVRLVIPEGFASWQIAERLEGLKVCDGEAFLKVIQVDRLEGFLFPATYEISIGLNPSTVAKKLVSEFNQKWTSEYENRAREIGFTKIQAITLASIIEREVRVRDELPLVSAVYHNRLKLKMRLDADPTVQYALGFWKSRLTYDDYRNTKSPYNTYLNGGLPPGPICSPGWDAVKAALWPAQSDALYFLAAEGGRHTFSNSYREHTNKVNKRNRQNRKP